MRAHVFSLVLLPALFSASPLRAEGVSAPAAAPPTYVLTAPEPVPMPNPAPATPVAPVAPVTPNSAAPSVPAPATPASGGSEAATSVAPAKGESGEPVLSSTNGTVPSPQPFELPKREEEIPQRFCLGVYRDAPVPDDLERVRLTVLEAARAWQLQTVFLAWYAPGKKTGQGVALTACTRDGVTVDIRKAGNDAEALDMEKRLAFPITPAEIAEIYLQNEVVADDDFKGRPVIFDSEVADIARGAFGKPYVFFPAHPGGVTGLTCYFDAKDPALRKLRKGSKVTVRAEVKGFLMQDVILDKCVVVELH